MKGSEKRKYTKKQVILMLVLAFLLASAVSYAWNLNVPYSFSPNTTISSSAMNSNFDYVGSRLGAFNNVGGTTASLTSTNSAAPQNFGSYTFTAPQNGYVVVLGSAGAVEEYRANTTCAQYAYVGVSTSPTSVGTSNYYYNSSSATGWIQHPMNAQTWLSVSGGSSYTVYFNAYAYYGSCTANYYFISVPKITVMFFPTYM